jgi:hypothetical protein
MERGTTELRVIYLRVPHIWRVTVTSLLKLKLDKPQHDQRDGL